MKRQNIYVLFLLLLFPGIDSVSTAQQPTGEEIIQKVNDIMSPVNSKGVMTQTILTTSGRKRTFEFEMYSANKGEKTLMRYIKPASVKGQAFLMLNHADDIWTYFPRTNRVRKLASHAKKQKVQGSDFTYEDIGSGDTWTEKFTPTNLGSDRLEEELCWKLQLDGKPEEEPPYRRMILWVRQSDYLPIHISYYEEKDIPSKSLVMEDIEVIERIPTAKHMIMRNHINDTETVMTIISVTYDWEPPTGFFSERNLKR